MEKSSGWTWRLFGRFLASLLYTVPMSFIYATIPVVLLPDHWVTLRIIIYSLAVVVGILWAIPETPAQKGTRLNETAIRLSRKYPGIAAAVPRYETYVHTPCEAHVTVNPYGVGLQWVGPSWSCRHVSYAKQKREPFPDAPVFFKWSAVERCYLGEDDHGYADMPEYAECLVIRLSNGESLRMFNAGAWSDWNALRDTICAALVDRLYLFEQGDSYFEEAVPYIREAAPPPEQPEGLAR